MVEQAVKDGAGGRDVTEQLAPFFDGTIGRHHGRTVLVTDTRTLYSVSLSRSRPINKGNRLVKPILKTTIGKSEVCPYGKRSIKNHAGEAKSSGNSATNVEVSRPTGKVAKVSESFVSNAALG